MDRILRFLADNPGSTRSQVRDGVIAGFKADGQQVPGGADMTAMRIISQMRDMERRGALKPLTPVSATLSRRTPKNASDLSISR